MCNSYRVGNDLGRNRGAASVADRGARASASGAEAALLSLRSRTRLIDCLLRARGHTGFFAARIHDRVRKPILASTIYRLGDNLMLLRGAMVFEANCGLSRGAVAPPSNGRTS